MSEKVTFVLRSRKKTYQETISSVGKKSVIIFKHSVKCRSKKNTELW